MTDGAMFGTQTGDALAELVHDAMCSGQPYRDRCRAAADDVARAAVSHLANAATRLMLALDSETDIVKTAMKGETIYAAMSLSAILEPLVTPVRPTAPSVEGEVDG